VHDNNTVGMWKFAFLNVRKWFYLFIFIFERRDMGLGVREARENSMQLRKWGSDGAKKK
jgi:hypothetical protein